MWWSLFGRDRAVLAMASLVWIQPHLFLDGKQLFVTRIFCSLYDGFIFMGNIVILM